MGDEQAKLRLILAFFKLEFNQEDWSTTESLILAQDERWRRA